MENLNEIVYKYLETKISSTYTSNILNGARGGYRYTIHSLTLQKGTSIKRLDMALLNAL